MRLSLRRRKAAQVVDDDALRAAWQCASLLLTYPDDELLAQLPLLGSVVAQLPDGPREPLARLVATLSEAAADPASLAALRTTYVDTFDYTRKCAPYLTYFTCGDTRKRGVALVQFKQAYRRAGVELADADAELPDYLPIVLEFGATAHLAAALDLVLQHRAGLEVLRLALQHKDSPWADAVVAVCATLPPLDGDEHDAVRRLVEQGPPKEDVGLDGYGELGLDPALLAAWEGSPGSGSAVRA